MRADAGQYQIEARSAAGIVAEVEAAVAGGRLAPGDPLPPVRRLAARLGISPATAAKAYAQLRARGVTVARERDGTRIAPRPPGAARPDAAVPPGARDLATGNPDPRLLPDLAAALRRLPAPGRGYGEPPVLPELAAAARRELAEAGVDGAALTVVNGAMDGVERVLAAHLRPGDGVAVEDPCYSAILDLLRARGLVPRPVRLDGAGMLPADLARALGAGAGAVIVTPRAQNPTGAAFTASRQRELAAVLRAAPGVLVVEDDHLGAVAGAPYRTVTAGRRAWAYVRSTSKALGPDLRLAVLAGDPGTVERVEWRLALGCGWVSTVLQRLVCALWADPRVAARADRAATTYARRRGRLLAELARAGVAAYGGSGYNVVVPVPDEDAVAQGLLRSGWAVRRGAPYRIAAEPFVRVTAATLRADEARRLAADVAAVLRPDRRTRLG